MTGKKRRLTLKQEKFCRLFASDKEFFGNGVQSYLEAYDLGSTKKNYNVAKQSAYRLLTNIDILARINELFEARGLNDAFVDKQLEKLITQDAEYHSKLGAIKEYNALKQRITKKMDLTSGGKPLKSLLSNIKKDVSGNNSASQNTGINEKGKGDSGRDKRG